MTKAIRHTSAMSLFGLVSQNGTATSSVKDMSESNVIMEKIEKLIEKHGSTEERYILDEYKRCNNYQLDEKEKKKLIDDLIQMVGGNSNHKKIIVKINYGYEKFPL